MLSRTVEDSGTVTSPLIPWNSCGAYMSGVLGVPTIEYLPYAIFNIANPLIALLFGFTGIGVERLSASAAKGFPGRRGQPAVCQTSPPKSQPTRTLLGPS